MASYRATPGHAWGAVDQRLLAVDVAFGALGPLATFGDSCTGVQIGASLTTLGAVVTVRLQCQRVSDNVFEQVGPSMVLNTADRSTTFLQEIPPGKYDGFAFEVSGIGVSAAIVDVETDLRFSAEV